MTDVASNAAPTAKILVVDDDINMIQFMAKALASVGHIRFAKNGEDALRLACEDRPDIILLDAEMPGLCGFEVCKALKNTPGLAEVPVIFVTSHTEDVFEAASLALGAVDFIPKPIRPAILVARVSSQLRLKQSRDQLKQMAFTDALTGAYSRRVFDEVLQREWSRGQRLQIPLTVLMADIDHFKAFNDGYGHPAGDAALRAVAQALARCVKRSTDVLARYGGEEFVAVLPDMDEAGAKRVADEMLGAVQSLCIPHAWSSVGRFVTVSIGGACCVPPAGVGAVAHGPETPATVGNFPSAVELVKAADAALYRAKQAGRARACVGVVGT